MGHDEQQLSDLVYKAIERRRDDVRVGAASIANEVLKEIDPDNVSLKLVTVGCHLQLRVIAGKKLAKLFGEDVEEGSAQNEMFPELQARYPAEHKRGEEPVYVKLEAMTKSDVAYNVKRLRGEAQAKMKHADSLEAWDMARSRVEELT